MVPELLAEVANSLFFPVPTPLPAACEHDRGPRTRRDDGPAGGLAASQRGKRCSGEQIRRSLPEARVTGGSGGQCQAAVCKDLRALLA